MTTYEIIRSAGIFVGPAFVLMAGALLGWVIRVERAHARIDATQKALWWLYRHNIPDMWKHIEELSALQGKAFTRPAETQGIETLDEAVRRSG